MESIITDSVERRRWCGVEMWRICCGARKDRSV